MGRSVSDHRALDAIAALLNTRRHPNDIAAALLLLITIADRVRETGRPAGRRYPKQPFHRVPKAEAQLRTAVHRCLSHGYDLPEVSQVVLDVYYGMLVVTPPVVTTAEEAATRSGKSMDPPASVSTRPPTWKKERVK